MPHGLTPGNQIGRSDDSQRLSRSAMGLHPLKLKSEYTVMAIATRARYLDPTQL